MEIISAKENVARPARGSAARRDAQRGAPAPAQLAEGTSKLGESRYAQSTEASANLKDSPRAAAAAKDEAGKYERLFAVPGGGGVSQLQVEGKRNALKAAENENSLLERSSSPWLSLAAVTLLPSGSDSREQRASC